MQKAIITSEIERKWTSEWINRLINDKVKRKRAKWIDEER